MQDSCCILFMQDELLYIWVFDLTNIDQKKYELYQIWTIYLNNVDILHLDHVGTSISLHSILKQIFSQLQYSWGICHQDHDYTWVFIFIVFDLLWLLVYFVSLLLGNLGIYRLEDDCILQKYSLIYINEEITELMMLRFHDFISFLIMGFWIWHLL